MNYNPYAPPEAPVASNPPPGGFGQPQPWTAQEALKVAWERFKIHGGVLIFAHFVSGLIVMVLGQISNVVVWTHVVDASTPGYLGVMVAGTVVTQVVAAFFNVGLTRIQLDVARGVTPKLETMFSGADRFLPMLGMNFVFFVAVLVGFLLFIVPGVLLCLVYPLAPYYVVEGGFGPLAALRKAWSASKGQRGELFVLSLYGFGLAIRRRTTCRRTGDAAGVAPVEPARRLALRPSGPRGTLHLAVRAGLARIRPWTPSSLPYRSSPSSPCWSLTRGERTASRGRAASSATATCA